MSASAARHGRVACATAPVDAADNRAVPEAFAPWRHEDLLRRDDKLHNLYFVGAGTNPGAGIPGVVGSAEATAGLMLA